ncbi:hypothetical protein QTP70_013643 [Hemibagrus guttatus]|uniref:Reverse transcriptase domain-containing protein n=1 Tax=Hemibagrus guttatus TaxID=175788 RepID=A0AAE0QC93_9TELE|nr:hypothetical protein QTP70_013643 [Hemibagrus guttatus]
MYWITFLFLLRPPLSRVDLILILIPSLPPMMSLSLLLSLNLMLSLTLISLILLGPIPTLIALITLPLLQLLQPPLLLHSPLLLHPTPQLLLLHTWLISQLMAKDDSAFRAGNKDALRTAQAKLSQAIREVKRAHSQRIHGHFQSSGDTWRMWQGIQSINNYRPAPPACDSDASLSDALNSFYAWFEAQNNVTVRKTIPPPEDQVLCLTTADVRNTLCRVNPRKAAGPDNIPGRVLRECAEQLADVFTDIFNMSLSSAVIPTCLKTTTIIPMPKKSPVSCLYDYCSVALTHIIMKSFEWLVMRQIKDLLPPSLDPMQFAYLPNRSTDDAITTTHLCRLPGGAITCLITMEALYPM